MLGVAASPVVTKRSEPWLTCLTRGESSIGDWHLQHLPSSEHLEECGTANHFHGATPGDADDGDRWAGGSQLTLKAQFHCSDRWREPRRSLRRRLEQP